MNREQQRRKRRAQFHDWWSDYSWFLWAGAVCLIFVFGYVGFHRHFTETHQHRSVADTAYLSLQLFPLGSGNVRAGVPWELQVARVLAPALALTGLVAAVRALYLAFRQGRWRVRGLRDHYVVCGCGRRGSLLAVALRESHKVVVIENGENPEYIERCRQKQVVVLEGDATDPALLEKAHLDRAAHLIALCGEDAVNARIAIAASAALTEIPNPDLQAHIHIADEEFAELVKERRGQFVNGSSGPFATLELIDVFKTAAAEMLNMAPAFDPQAWRPNDRLIVVGLGELGQHLVVNAVTRWRDADRSEPLPISILDRDANEKIAGLRFELEGLNEKWEPTGWSGDLAGAAFDSGDYRSETDAKSVRQIYVCLDDEHLALTTTLRLEKQFPGVPIKVRMTTEHQGLGTLLPVEQNIKPFDLFEAACRPDRLLGSETNAKT